MATRIKCPQCHTWNEDQDYCTQCHHVLNHELIREQERAKLREEEQTRPITQFYNYLDRLRASNSPADKIKYLFLNSSWWVFLALVTALIAAVALAPG